MALFLFMNGRGGDRCIRLIEQEDEAMFLISTDFRSVISAYEEDKVDVARKNNNGLQRICPSTMLVP